MAPKAAAPEKPELVKLLILGNSSVGKTSMMLNFVDGHYNPYQNSTLGVDMRQRITDVGGRRVRLQVWDSAGQERFHNITAQYYRSAKGIVLVYDITNEESFNDIRRWVAQIAAVREGDVQRILVGNKVDLDQQRVVSTERGLALAEEYGIPFFETSAANGIKIEETFKALAGNVLAANDAEVSARGHDGSFPLNPGSSLPDRRQGCCLTS